MSIFNQIKSPNKGADREQTIVRDFERRIPYWSYRPVDYQGYETFMEYQSEIDSYLEKLFAGEVDSGNADALDTLIISTAKQAEKDLERQRTEHLDTIKSFDIRAKSDRKAFESELSLLRTELEMNRKEQEKYEQLLEEDQFLKRRRQA